MLGWTEEELRGQLAHQTFHHQHGDGAPYPEKDCPLLTVRTEGRVTRSADDFFTHKDGRIIPVAYSASPLRNESGDIDGVVVVFRDTTAETAERLRAQRELNALTWLGRIQDALDEDRMVLYSQPIIPLTGGPASEELLLRLVTPTGEIVQPGTFLPIAERYGLIADIDQWVITKAIERAATGRRVEANMSAWTIANTDLLPLIERLIRGDRRRSVVAGLRAHRNRVHAGPGSRQEVRPRSARPRLRARTGRLRHRLRQLHLSEDVALHVPQDRHRVRQRPRQQRREPARRGRHRQPRQGFRPTDHRRRRRRPGHPGHPQGTRRGLTPRASTSDAPAPISATEDRRAHSTGVRNRLRTRAGQSAFSVSSEKRGR